MAKLTTLLILISFMQLRAEVYAQAGKLDLKVKNVSILEVFEEIEDNSEYRFFYDNDQVDLTKKVSIDSKQEELANVLNELFKGTDLTYQVKDLLILVQTKTPNVNTLIVQQQQQRTVTGTVTDESGEPLPGVTVIIKGTTQGTVTDVDGNYTLTDIPDDATLQFSFVGMLTQEIEVGNQTEINVSMVMDAIGIEEVVAIGYGTVKKSDLTGSVASVEGEDFKALSISQVSDMLTGTMAGLNAGQGTSAAGGSSLEVRGPTSLNAGTDPLIVLDGVIFNGSLREINFNDVVKVDILKDASSAAVYGSKAASGVVLITTAKGKQGKPTINFITRFGLTESYNQRRGLGPEEFIQFRQDFFKQTNPELFNSGFYHHPDKLPDGLTIDKWRALGNAPLENNIREWMARLNFYDVEQKNYLANKTIDWYDQVFRTGLRQEYDVNISGGTDLLTYYWSMGYNDYEGIRLGDDYSVVRTRLNLDFQITNWLNVGLNAQFSNEDNGKTGKASLIFYPNSPYGELFDEDGNLRRLPHGHTATPLLSYYRDSKLDKTNRLFANLYGNIKLPYGFNFKVSYQPYSQSRKYFMFTTISEELAGLSGEISTSERRESSTLNWMLDNLLTWKKRIGIHNFDLTLLANFEENQYWSTTASNQNFQPNQELRYHALQYGDSPGISNNDTRSTGDAYMGRLNYSLLERYLLTASVRRDGYSAFGTKHPRATFPAFAFAWILSEENFFKIDLIDRLKIRLSWGVNGNRDIGIYSALARTGADLWHDGTTTRIGVFNSTLANSDLRWERTEALNLGLDISMIKNRINLTADVYDMTTNNLLMARQLPEITGFSSIMSNLGELGNKGFEMTLNTVNVSKSDFIWKSSLVFSFNRNKIKRLFGDISTYTLMGEEYTGDVPDFSNEWFPGQALDVVWDYEVVGIWQLEEKAEAALYNLEPGDFKVVDLDDDGSYVNLNDKQFIGHRNPRYRLGLRNDFSFLNNFTASIFIRADLGHITKFPDALNAQWHENYKWNRREGPMPYWTVDNANNEYARINPYMGAFEGGIMIYKPASFIRIQDFSLTYDLSSTSVVSQRLNLKNLQVFGSVRNLATFTKWPGWDPESGMNPMPRTFTIGLNFSL